MSTAAPKPVGVAKVRAEAESWIKTYPVARDAVPSDAWDWLNGRCHPRIVLALCERIEELEVAVSNDLWLRQKAVDAHDDARREYQRHEQRSADLSLLADALDGFFYHPNTPDEDRAELVEALKRLLGGSA